MEASKFSDAQIAFVLKQVEDGMPIGEVSIKGVLLNRSFTCGIKTMLNSKPHLNQFLKIA